MPPLRSLEVLVFMSLTNYFRILSLFKVMCAVNKLVGHLSPDSFHIIEKYQYVSFKISAREELIFGDCLLDLVLESN